MYNVYHFFINIWHLLYPVLLLFYKLFLFSHAYDGVYKCALFVQQLKINK